MSNRCASALLLSLDVARNRENRLHQTTKKLPQPCISWPPAQGNIHCSFLGECYPQMLKIPPAARKTFGLYALFLAGSFCYRPALHNKHCMRFPNRIRDPIFLMCYPSIYPSWQSMAFPVRVELFEM
ncbi:hypothetical protein BJY01DRAFT_50024 [Aspergillus pseudoustus]|uniref:Uncharacterized protein n=1 Tax=Aspergillus pseudoustus TaxID=1810923 RepID=A0ABR4KNP6_9EURO